MKYINLFDTYSDYKDYMDDGLISYPNVSYCIDEDKVYYALDYYSSQYFTFEVVEAGNITFKKNAYQSPTVTIQYSSDDGQTWTSLTTSITEQSLGTFAVGDKVIIKGNNTQYATSGYQNSFGGTAKTNVYGNIMSLLYGDDFISRNRLTAEYLFRFLFGGYTNLLSAENLILPTTTLIPGCYASMFSGCTSLIKTPKLPAITLADRCYNYMFNGCTSLTTTPELPVTTGVSYCYAYMFNGCTSLVNAPEIKLTTAAQYCCYNMFTGCTSLVNAPELGDCTQEYGSFDYMFDGCTSLNYIKCLFSSSSQSTSYWTRNVAATGTFIKNPLKTNWPTGQHGIPSGWNVIDDGNQVLATIDGVPVYLDSTKTYADQLSNQLYSQPTYDPQQYEDEFTYMINMYDDAVAGTYYTTCTPVAYMISIYYDDVEVQVDANQTLYDQGYDPAYNANIAPDGEPPMDCAYDFPQSNMSYYSYFTPVFYCPNCGNELNYMPDSMNPCSNCGYPLLYTCPNCGAGLEYEPDASMPCPDCGYPLLYTCPNCGLSLEYEPDTDNPCPYCDYPNNE